MPQSTLCVLTSKLVLLVNDDHYWQMLLHFRFSNQLVKGTILLIVSYHHGIVYIILEQSIYRGFLLILPDSYHTLVIGLP